MIKSGTDIIKHRNAPGFDAMQTAIPCLFIRGGTSRGLYFLKSDLPDEQAAIERVLLAAMGSPDPYQIDGIGGATSLTNKVAILSPSAHPWADVDYLFAQVNVHRPSVDWQPTCGNTLAGVGPAAIERGLVEPQSDKTIVKIRAVNTGALIEAIVSTPNGRVTYNGETTIDGVPGTAAPIWLYFSAFTGAKTGHLFPTGVSSEDIDGVRVTCIDAAMPMVIAAAETMGKTGYETKAELDADPEFLARLEQIRRIGGDRMGLGDVSDSVIPKFSIIAPPCNGGSLTSRYFVPHVCHRAHALTGAIGVACCAHLAGTVAHDLAVIAGNPVETVTVEHPSGSLAVILETSLADRSDNHPVFAEPVSPATSIVRAGVLRTARLLFSGEVHVPVKF